MWNQSLSNVTSSCPEIFNQYKVRSKHYTTYAHKSYKKKEQSDVHAYVFRSAHVVSVEEKVCPLLDAYPLPENMSNSFMFVFVFQLPERKKKKATNFVVIFEERSDLLQDDAFHSILSRVCENGSTFGAERVKIIPFISSGTSWAVKSIVNNRCGQISEALEVVQCNGPGYIEINVNMNRFKSTSIFAKMAKTCIDLVIPCLKDLDLNLAFMFQGEHEEELPERILGSVCLSKLNI